MFASGMWLQLEGVRVELERRQARIEELEQQLVRVRQTASESEVLVSRLRVELHELSERPAPRSSAAAEVLSPLSCCTRPPEGQCG